MEQFILPLQGKRSIRSLFYQIKSLRDLWEFKRFSCIYGAVV